MRTPRKTVRSTRRTRRGAIALLVALAIPFLLLMASFAVNVAYMQMVREQLQVSCDSAAKAALVNYGATQSASTARTFARTVSAKNLVAGQTLSLPDGNIVFGNATKNGSGVYNFSPNVTPTNSVSVTGAVNPPLLLAPFLPISTFSTNQVSVVTRVSHDIVLVLDRSASMSFDLSSSEFNYPPGPSTFPLYYYFQPPDPSLSRWAALTSAVNSFISVLQARNLDVHVGLVTYSEAYTLGSLAAAQATLDVQLTPTYSQVSAAMNAYGQQALLGDTNISAGLALGQGELTSTRARTTADRTIILLTDGIPTTGNTNIASITQTYRSGSQIVTHVITLGAEAGSGAAQTTMMNAASNGNGQYFNAPSAATLTQAFQTIADSLPAVYIQ
jgi:Ca-activated chloride channel homolog